MIDIENFIQDYLRGEGNNIPLADGLKITKRYYLGTLQWKTSNLERCCGPESDMRYRTNEYDFNRRVNGIINRIKDGWEMPPLLVNYENKKMTISDGNHRYEAFNRLKKEFVPIILWITSEEDYFELIKSCSLEIN